MSVSKINKTLQSVLDNDFAMGEASKRDKIPQDVAAAGKVSMVTLAQNLGNHQE